MVVSSTGVVGMSHTAPPGTFPITTGPTKNTLLHTSAVPSKHTLTIVVKLPGHQTLSYNPIVEDLTELIYSLERLMQAHRSKRDLASASPGPAESTSYSSLSASTAHRYQHGHQHDHLHDPHRGRGLNNSDHAVLTNDAATSVASGPFTASATNSVATGDENPTATVSGMIGAASLSEHLVDQSAASETNASPLAGGQNLPHKSVTGQMTVPQSLLEDQSAVSKSTSAYSATSSTSKAAVDADSQSILQQQFSMAGRVSPFGEMSSILRGMIFGLWVFFFATMYYWQFPQEG